MALGQKGKEINVDSMRVLPKFQYLSIVMYFLFFSFFFFGVMNEIWAPTCPYCAIMRDFNMALKYNVGLYHN